MAEEQGLTVDEQGYQTCMQQQKERSRVRDHLLTVAALAGVHVWCHMHG